MGEKKSSIPLIIMKIILSIVFLISLTALLYYHFIGPVTLTFGSHSIHLTTVDNPFLILYISFILLLFVFSHNLRVHEGGPSGDEKNHSHSPEHILFVILFMGFLLRIAYLPHGDFLICDEGLYDHCARQIAFHDDVFLKYVWIDKPPVFFYLLASCYRIFGPGDFIAWVPNVMASMLLIYLIFVLGRRWFSVEAGLAAASLQAVNPVDIYQSNLVLLDTTLVLWIIVAVLFAERKNFFLSGLFFGLAIGTKQSALFTLPWFTILLFANKSVTISFWSIIKRWFRGLLLVIIPLFWWSSSINQFAMFAKQAKSYGFESFVTVTEIGGRLWQWLILMDITNNKIADLVLFGFLIVCIGVLFYQVRFSLDRTIDIQNKLRSSRQLQLIFLILFLVFLQLVILSVFPFHFFDRYILVLVPFISLLLGHFLVKFLPQEKRNLYLAGLILVIFFQSFVGFRSQVPIPSGYMAFNGLKTVTDYLQSSVSPDIPVFESRLEWHLYSYLDQYGYNFHRYNSVLELTETLWQKKFPTFYIIDDLRDDIPIVEIKSALKKERYKIKKIISGPDEDYRIRYVLWFCSRTR